MITLKNGIEIQYNEDFDVFFQMLLEKVVIESRKEAEKHFYDRDSDSGGFKDLFLKELMDNAIYISHQLFEMSKKNRKFVFTLCTFKIRGGNSSNQFVRIILYTPVPFVERAESCLQVTRGQGSSNSCITGLLNNLV